MDGEIPRCPSCGARGQFYTQCDPCLMVYSWLSKTGNSLYQPIPSHVAKQMTKMRDFTALALSSHTVGLDLSSHTEGLDSLGRKEGSLLEK